jgi:hypothetical protein
MRDGFAPVCCHEFCLACVTSVDVARKLKKAELEQKKSKRKNYYKILGIVLSSFVILRMVYARRLFS